MCKNKKQKLYELLYEWTIDETCDCCEHLNTFREGDMRHPCNKCAAYELFKLDKALKQELNDRVKQIIDIVKNN